MRFATFYEWHFKTLGIFIGYQVVLWQLKSLIRWGSPPSKKQPWKTKSLSYKIFTIQELSTWNECLRLQKEFLLSWKNWEVKEIHTYKKCIKSLTQLTNFTPFQVTCWKWSCPVNRDDCQKELQSFSSRRSLSPWNISTARTSSTVIWSRKMFFFHQIQTSPR